MLIKSPDEALCAYHQRRLQDQRVSESAQELLACGTDFADAPAVNRFLGALVRQVTLKRIPRRDAVTLAYICQLLAGDDDFGISHFPVGSKAGSWVSRPSKAR